MLSNPPAMSFALVRKKSCNRWLNRTESIAIPILLVTFLSRIAHRDEDVQRMISAIFASNLERKTLLFVPYIVIWSIINNRKCVRAKKALALSTKILHEFSVQAP